MLKSLPLRARQAEVCALCGILFSLAVPAPAQVRPAKPPVAPRDGRPAQIKPLPNKVMVDTLTFRLRNDRRLDGAHIRVTAAGHRVGLYGSVPDYHQRRIAREIAQSMLGITYVADHLRVQNVPPPPAQLVKDVQAQLAANPITANVPIHVQARRDVVTLTGMVKTLLIKQTAIALAHGVPRVSVVQNHLIVPMGTEGQALAAQVRVAIGRDASVRVSSLRVLVNGGYIYLRGTVSSKAAKRAAGDAAASVPGVTGLTNSLVVLR